MKTARFTSVVERSGRPAPHTLWSAPEDDREFQRAVKAGRVMTVHQENVGAKKDYGVVGFTGDRAAEFLIFPKSIEAFAGRRIVGVNYDLLEPPKSPSASEKARRAKAEKTAKQKEAARRRSASSAVEDKSTEASTEKEMTAVPPESRDAEKKSSEPARDETALLRAVRAAMKELQRGKAVAAYQRLEKAVARTSG